MSIKSNNADLYLKNLIISRVKDLQYLDFQKYFLINIVLEFFDESIENYYISEHKYLIKIKFQCITL